jgi:hypothetical protein
MLWCSLHLTTSRHATYANERLTADGMWFVEEGKTWYHNLQTVWCSLSIHTIACTWQYTVYCILYGKRSRCSDSLRAGRSGCRILVEATFSAPSLLHKGYRLILGVKAAGPWRWPRISCTADVKERVELYSYYPSGPSCSVLGWTLHCTLYLLVLTMCNGSTNALVCNKTLI